MLFDFQDHRLRLAVAIHGVFQELAELADHLVDVRRFNADFRGPENN
jgi:hypothetical protein